MSSLTSHDDVPVSELDGAVKDYSRDKVYVYTAIFLAVITIVEVFTYAAPDFPVWADDLLIPVLMILMAVKFVMVVLEFMHLRHDAKIFHYLFWSGFGLAIAVYIGFLATFKFFLGA